MKVESQNSICEFYVANAEMPRPSEHVSDATELLGQIEQGDPKAAAELLVLVYEDLRRLARIRMAQEAPGHTLQPTALVHDVWLRLIGNREPTFENKAHFFSAAAEAMRRILIDRARRRQTRRHGGQHERVVFDGFDIAAPEQDDQMLSMHEALGKLAGKRPVQAEVVKLRYFLGMTNEETAEILGISPATAKNYWTFARAWLYNEIKKS